MIGLMAELERDIISERSKMGLAACKAAGIKLGKPKGTLQASKLDEKREAIEELLKHRVSKAAIARMMGTSRGNLLFYLRTRQIGQSA
jgi:DNA invertase Pin-like site-specific DNA recombinase